MITGGVGSNSVTVAPDPTTTAAQPAYATPVGNAATAAQARIGNAAATAAQGRLGNTGDTFVPPSNPNIALPDLGDATAAKSAAYQDFAAAKAELRHARNERPGNGHRAADIRHAQQDVRAAKAEMNALDAGGGADRYDPTGAADPTGAMDAPGFADPTASGGVDPNAGAAVDPGQPTAQDQAITAANGGSPLVEGHELPQISQLHPKGDDGNYTDGDMNCAPAALAMVARGNPNATLDGKPISQFPDAALINRIGKYANTDEQGTSPNALIDTAEAMGLQTSTHQGGLNTNFYDQALQQGGSVIANGAYYFGDELAGHFVTVSAKTQDGNYVVNDPMQGRLEWTPNQLDLFLRSNPTNGGVSIACF